MRYRGSCSSWSGTIANATILDELATALPDAEIRRLDWL
ncbi:hypothetical protein Q6284_28160, partial [Klebsiella pneumoniae]|nr:hypothetical protein [Klebsiella pneumoniae]